MFGQILFTTFKCTKEYRLTWFPFQPIHRILPTNNYLHKICRVNSPLCYFCQQTLETIEHIFAECFVVKEIWIEVERLTTKSSFDK